MYYVTIKAILNSYQGHFGLSTVEELEMAIRNCKVLIFEAAEHSERRKNLVNKLVQLRMRLQEAKVKLDFPHLEMLVRIIVSNDYGKV